jgi:LAS superfamily LD-carboxypeptidase LdcB
MPRPAAAPARPGPGSRPGSAPAWLVRLLVLGLAALLALTAPPAMAQNVPTENVAGSPEAQLAEAEARVREAEARRAEMAALVDRTAAVLEEGTRRLEQGQARLAVMQKDQARAERAADQALQRAAAARTRVAIVVSASYRSPVPPAVKLALTAGPDDIADVMVARADLDRVQGDSQQLLRKAVAARVEAEQAVSRAAQLAAEAAAVEQALAAEVEQLRVVAEQSQADLDVAAAALAAALSDQQSAAAAAAAEASAREAERLAEAAAGSYLVAMCTGMPTGPQANGMLNPDALCPMDDAPGHALRPDAAAGFNALNAAYKEAFGGPICVTDSYRSYAGQVAVYAAKPNLAAIPGRSNHGWGVAIDFGCGIQTFGSPQHEWMRANAGRFGWFHPEWARINGSRPEAWHWEFAG